MAVTEEIAAFSKESDRHEAVHQAAIPRRDAAMYDETWWSSRVVSLANMMAVQVQNEEVGRQVQRTQPRPSAGGKDDFGEDEEDEDIAEDIEEAQKYEEDDEDGDELPPEEGIDEESNECSPEAGLHEDLQRRGSLQ